MLPKVKLLRTGKRPIIKISHSRKKHVDWQQGSKQKRNARRQEGLFGYILGNLFPKTAQQSLRMENTDTME